MSEKDEKVRRTLSLDADLVAELAGEGDDPRALSHTVNDILRNEVEARRRHQSLVHLVADLDATFGPPDRADVDRFAVWLKD